MSNDGKLTNEQAQQDILNVAMTEARKVGLRSPTLQVSVSGVGAGADNSQAREAQMEAADRARFEMSKKSKRS